MDTSQYLEIFIDETKEHLQNLNIITAFDYVKIGPYIKEFGSLDNKTTNQQLFKFDWKTCTLENITYKFWNDRN